MDRVLKSSEAIQEEVQRRIDMRIGDDEDAVVVHPPIALASPDEKGCNWTIEGFDGDHGFFKLVGLAVLEVKARWNLQS